MRLLALLTRLRPAGLALLAGLLIAPPAPACDGDTITGAVVRVKDGDTMRINRTDIRLYGIDAPEKSQTCGKGNEIVACGEDARAALAALVEGQALTCSRMPGNDRYGRMIARCTTPAGLDIGRAMVEQGYALAYRRYSDDYVAAEAAAEAARKGLWSERFVKPWIWRQQGKRR